MFGNLGRSELGNKRFGFRSVRIVNADDHSTGFHEAIAHPQDMAMVQTYNTYPEFARSADRFGLACWSIVLPIPFLHLCLPYFPMVPRLIVPSSRLSADAVFLKYRGTRASIESL